MLDGRIDTQGAVSDLDARGVLDDITRHDSAEARKEAPGVEAVASADDAVLDAEEAPATGAAKKPRKLIEEEKREEGSVKWNIYKTYLKASSVHIRFVCIARWLRSSRVDPTGPGSFSAS